MRVATHYCMYICEQKTFSLYHSLPIFLYMVSVMTKGQYRKEKNIPELISQKGHVPSNPTIHEVRRSNRAKRDNKKYDNYMI